MNLRKFVLWQWQVADGRHLSRIYSRTRHRKLKYFVSKQLFTYYQNML